MDETKGGISAFFEEDHRAIDALVADLRHLSAPERLARLSAFDERLERHIRWEEELLFPAAAAAHPGLAAGPIPVMLGEHAEIRRCKAAALEALRSGDEAAAVEAQKGLFHVLSHHNAKEEQVLYPACDQLLSAERAEAILAQLRGATDPAA